MARERVQVIAVALSRASPANVYAAAKDSSAYPRWSRIKSFEAVCDGEGDPFGVGSRRIFRTPPLKLLEEVVELIPDARVGYVLLKGLPLRHYRANIDIDLTESGLTRIRWSSSFWTVLPGTRGLFRRFMQAVFDEMAPQLAAEAERVEINRAR